MRALTEALNAWADQARQFAWPMLWQSSLLIGVLFALDFLLRRKVRPAVRYALWLVVLVKLLLPPSLAFPTSPGWWLRPTKAALARPRPTTVVVTYDALDLPAPAIATAPVFIPPPPPPLRLTPACCTLLGMVIVSLGLLAWMLVRWLQVTREARRAAAAPAWLHQLLPELPRPLQLKLTDHPHSPAVCGLFRPVILLPRSLVDRLPPEQLRAVLLHELLHFRRGDVWVNCAQALLQITYWWHPLLWLANARIRRLREEAVDDAVMLALKEDAETYAPTLLEVAKLALQRPLATLGLVGILESRSSLRQRIERLIDFRPPRNAGLTLGSALAVLGFAALAVPMGEASPPKVIPESADSLVATNTLGSTPLASPALAEEAKVEASTLVHDGKLLYEMGKLDEAEAKLRLALKTDPHNKAADYYLNVVSEAKSRRANPIKRELLPVPNPYSRTNGFNSGADRQAILTKLDRIRLDRISFDRLPLREVVRLLADESRQRDPEKRGINFLLTLKTDSDAQATAATLGPDGQPLPTAPAEQVDVGAISINLNPPLTNMRLADVLDAIVKVADRPIKYSIEDYAIVFSPRGHETPPLYVQTFRVDPNILIEKLHVAMGPVATNVSERVTRALVDYFAQAGVDLDPSRNPGKAFFYHPAPTRLEGMLLVRATLQDLDIVARAIAALGVPTGQASAPMAARQAPAGQVMSEARSGEANPIKRELVPVPNPYARTNVVHLGTGRQALIARLDRIRFDSVSFDGLPLPEVVLFLADESRKRDPDKRGINFILNQGIVSGTNAAAPTLGPDGHPLPAAPPGQADLNAITIKINPPLTNIRLADVLDAIVKVADQPIKYSIEDYAIVFSTVDPKAVPLYVRSFKVDPNALARNLAAEKAPVEMDSPKTITQALVNFFKRVGVDLDPTRYPLKSIFFNDRQGMLLVRSTLQDLDVIEVALQTLTIVPPQINLKCKIVEVSQEDDIKALGFDWYLGNTGNMLMNPGTNSAQVGTAPTYTGAPTAAKPLGVFPGRLPHGTEIAPGGGQLGVAPTYSGAPTAASPLGMFPGSPPSGSVIPSGSDSYLSAVRQPGSDGRPFTLTGILTDPQYRIVIKALQQRNGANFLAEPSVTTLSGRQAQCRTMSRQALAMRINKQALTPPGITSTNDNVSAVFETEPMEFGISLDLVPTVLDDGYTINLPATVNMLEFAGYEATGTNRVAVYLNGKQHWVAPPRAKVQSREVAATVKVWDGQTLVLGGLMSENIIMMKDKVPVLGDLPLMGRFFRSESKTTQKRNLLVFITPTIIDPAGNRVHTDEEMPFARDGTPQQPTR